MVKKKNNCMFALPHELTELGEYCGLFKGQLACNGYGEKCCGYQPHDQHTRKALAEAIAKKRNRTMEARDEVENH